jgi:hypothetical protein
MRAATPTRPHQRTSTTLPVGSMSRCFSMLGLPSADTCQRRRCTCNHGRSESKMHGQQYELELQPRRLPDFFLSTFCMTLLLAMHVRTAS